MKLANLFYGVSLCATVAAFVFLFIGGGWPRVVGSILVAMILFGIGMMVEVLDSEEHV